MARFSRFLLCFSIAALLALTGCNLVRTADVTPVQPALSVRFESPDNQTQVYAGQEISLLLVAEDRNGPGVARVELSVDDRPHQEGTPEVGSAVPIFTVEMRWKATGPGLHALSAVAFRADGTPSDPATIVIEVVP